MRRNRHFQQFSSASLLVMAVRGVTHRSDDWHQERVPWRCHSLDEKRDGQPVASDARLAELSPRAVYAGELRGVSVRRTVS
jgi:hypothetical protein